MALTARRGGGQAGRVPFLVEPVEDRFVRRRITTIWGLLFFNGLGSISGSVIPIPKPVSQMCTMGSLALALLLAVCLNRRLVIRPNLVLGLVTVLAITAAATSIRGLAGPGALARSARLVCFVLVLWLLTPWWGRRDLLLARCHLRAVIAVSGLVLLGLLVAPGLALSGAGQGRLISVLWPIPAPQVAEYAALAAGMALVMWLSGVMPRGPALFVAGVGVAMLLASQTRTALIGLVAGLLAAGATSFLFQRRFRKAALACAVLLPFVVVLVGPAFYQWFTRDQSSEQLSGLTGRKQVWTALVESPRPEFNQWFGFGLSDKSFDGRPIDSTWLAAYHDQGLIAVGIIAVLFVFLLLVPAFRPAGPGRSVATFVTVYCLIASYTEVGLGDASNYLLVITMAASLVTTHDAELDRPSSALTTSSGRKPSGPLRPVTRDRLRQGRSG